jgi:hypothetical protein
LEKAAKHGAQRGVKIKKMWDSADGYQRIEIGHESPYDELGNPCQFQAIALGESQWALDRYLKEGD